MLKNQFKSIFTIPVKVFALAIFLFTIGNISAQSKTISVAHFDKIIVSPHIQVNFVKGDIESVIIKTTTVPNEKINVEVVGKTLRLYLDGAKMVTKSEKVGNDKWKNKRSIYEGTIVTAIVTYKNLEELSLRGEETFVCESVLEGEKFRLKIYGESQVYLNKAILGTLQTTIYGESYLELKEGTIERQKITAYGETKINSLGVNSTSVKITAYGEGSYRVKVLDHLKVTAYGEATIAYEGDPEVDRGITIGEVTIRKIL